MTKLTFRGFRRKQGRAGVRNDLWVIPATACLNGTLRSLLASYHKQYWIDAVRLLEHNGGCSRLAGGGNLWAVERALSSLALHPNAAGVLVVGLECEDFPLQSLMERVEMAGAGSVVHTLTLGKNGIIDEIPAQLDRLGANAPRTREVFPFSHLCAGLVRRCLRCERDEAHSDLLEGFSGWLTTARGTVLLAGGSEREDATLEYGMCVEGTGRREIVTSPESLPGALTSLAVSGAQILICDSDIPASFAAPVPTIRLRLNSNAENPCLDWIDFNPAAESGKRLADLFLAVAEGERTVCEVGERRDICDLTIDAGGFWRYG